MFAAMPRGIGVTGSGGLDAFATVLRAIAPEGCCFPLRPERLAEGAARERDLRVAALTSVDGDAATDAGTVEQYLAAIAQLFLALPPDGVAVLPSGDVGDLLTEILPAGAKAARFALTPDPSAELFATSIATTAEGMRIAIGGARAAGFDQPLFAPVHGEAWAEAIVCAALAAMHAGYTLATIAPAIARVEPAASTFFVVADRPLVVVDEARTPEAIARVRRALGAFGRRRAIWVAEDAVLARAGVAGDARPAPHASRRRAIARAVAEAGDEDAVVLLGVGAAHALADGARTIAWSERRAALRALEEAGRCGR
jgi:UDP-N-acetylmuramyl tripeptide synthase